MAFRETVQQMRVSVRIQSDASLDGIRLQYDSGGAAAEVAHIYESSAPTRVEERQGWTEVSFSVGPAYLGNRQNAGADFRLFLDGRACHIASLQVDLVKTAH